MFKDRDEINQRNQQAQEDNLAALAEIVRNTGIRTDARKQALLGFLPDKGTTPHVPAHLLCDYSNSDNDRVTEKRICRCLYYFNCEEPAQEAKCLTCMFPWKKKNISDYRILDYEVPMPAVIDGVGGIDLVLQDMKTGFFAFASEVKPENSTETLARMCAEILTYCELVNYKLPKVDDKITIHPAICFFKGSKQWNDFIKFKDDPNLQEIMKEVRVFYITYDANTISFHDTRWEPIC